MDDESGESAEEEITRAGKSESEIERLGLECNEGD